MQRQRHLDKTGVPLAVHRVCTNNVCEIMMVWVCTMFDQSLLVENKFTQFTLSKLLRFFVCTRFTQVYTVCTEFAPNSSYTVIEFTSQPVFVLGKSPVWEMCKLSVNFSKPCKF